jgi:hypothetical protein
MPRPHHPKRNTAVQQEFKKNSPTAWQPSGGKVSIPATESKPLVVFFEDEGRFGRLSRKCIAG